MIFWQYKAELFDQTTGSYNGQKESGQIASNFITMFPRWLNDSDLLLHTLDTELCP